MPKLIERILELISSQSAGSPTDTQVKWTHLKPGRLASYTKKKVCKNFVGKYFLINILGV